MALSIGTAWDQTRDIISRDGGLIATVVAALIVLPSAISTTIAPESASVAQESANASGPGGIVQIVMMLISQVGALALTVIALKPGLAVGEAIATGARRLLPALGAVLLYVIPMLILFAILLSAFVGQGTPEEMMAGIKNLGGGQLLVLIGALLFLLYLGIRFMLANPVAVSESSNPVTILKRSWVLTRGHFLRLFGLLVLIGLVALLLSAVAGLLGGVLIAILFGPILPMTVGAMVLGLIGGIANAAFITLFVIMVARIYAQLVSTASVPVVEDRSA